jgi:hypothetical protein
MDIESFMKREFGARGIKLLNELYAKLGVDDIAAASDDIKKKFLSEVQPEFRQKSLSKAGVLTSEVMSIIKLRDDSTKGGAVQKVDHEFIKRYISLQGQTQLKSTYAKIEAIFNLFWVNASEAFQKGVSVPVIHKVTSNILAGVKEDLYSICEEIEKKFNLDTSSKNGIMSHTKKEGFNLSGDKLESVEDDTKDPVEVIFNEFKRTVDTSYDKFYKLFMKTLDEDIELRKQGKDDTQLREQTKKDTKIIWDDILTAYEVMRRKLEHLQKEEEKKLATKFS